MSKLKGFGENMATAQENNETQGIVFGPMTRESVEQDRVLAFRNAENIALRLQELELRSKVEYDSVNNINIKTIYTSGPEIQFVEHRNIFNRKE